MRFKTRVRIDKVPALLRIVQALDRIEKHCVLYLTPTEDERVRLVIQPDVTRGIAAYADLTKASLLLHFITTFPFLQQ